ncbi:putative transcription factor WD40-like family [Helianthus anomalus]
MSNHITEDNEDNDCFHDSLDRLLSSATCSSSSSCSVSEHEDNNNKDDDDTGGLIDSNCIPIPRFPMGVVDNYDVWISRPSSVDERRMRLLRRMGLSRDSSLFRRKHSLSSMSDQLQVLVSSSSNPSFTRSTPAGYQHFNCSNNSSTNSPVTDPVTVLMKSVSSNVDNPVVSVSVNGDLDSIPVANLDLETRNDGEVVETVCSDDAVCLIKNLDNGKEFVVDEVREDGMWGKLKEVGTERRLTMEEFEMCVGRSPIVQELMRRQNVEAGDRDSLDGNDGGNGSGLKKKSGWLKNIKNVASSVAGYRERRSSGDGDTSSEKGGRRSSSATDDSQDVSFHGPERVRVRQYGKSCKDLTALFKSQEIQAHSGSIWTIKFSLDGKYLASAGEDRVIHVWQVVSLERKGDLLFDKQEDGNLYGLSLLNGSPEPGLASPNSQVEKKKRGRLSIGRKSTSLDHIVVPETMFGLSEKPFCSFEGHLHDVLDLSWSKSQHLLSSSMDKTVRLWHLSNKSCLKIFSHNDYVTCIQFNPVDDRYFISGSLDAKVRIWSVPDHQVVDWNDMNEMVTAACYTPDGQAALVGSYKGNCCLYNTTENKLQQKSQINLRNKKTNSRHRKITGFQFAPGTTSEVLVTSADSRVRVVDGLDLVHKFKGFRNTNRQVSASVTSNGRYVVCASEDSHVYVWKHEGDARASRHKGVTVTHSYEHFHCQDVSIAIPWPGKTDTWGFQNGLSGEPNSTDHFDDISAMNHPPTPEDQIGSSPFHGIITSASNGYFFDRFSATWPEEKLVSALKNPNKLTSADFTNGSSLSKSGWGMVIVTAGLHGEIRTFQNFGLPVRI